MVISQIYDYLLLALGLGFVIFFHELGHFLAAKYCDVKVEQFAVGFGPAIFSWRKGFGVQWGSSGEELQELQKADADGHLVKGLKDIGETEYRLNWIPLGGYVKMLGQDDLRPGVTADDPRAYNNKSIRARMMIVSAGVIMNVILAAICFMIVFLIGYPAPPSIVGEVLSDSPAAHAARADGVRVGLQPGDEILRFNGKNTVGDFTKVQLGVALSEEGESIPVIVKHPDGKIETLYVTPARMRDEPHALLALGITPPMQLEGPDPKLATDWDVAMMKKCFSPDALAIAPGDTITQINGQDVKPNQFWKLTDALAASDGKPVDLTVRTEDGKIVHRQLTPHLITNFDKGDLNFLGMAPRVAIASIGEKSTALGKLRAGDVVVSLEGANNDQLVNPTQTQMQRRLIDAGNAGQPVTLTVLSPGAKTPHEVPHLIPSVNVDNGNKGLGVGLGYDEQHLVVAQVKPGSPAADAHIPSGATLTAIDGKPIQNWFQLRDSIIHAKPGQKLAISYVLGSEHGVGEIKLTADDIESAQMIYVGMGDDVALRPSPGVLQTNNPLVAIAWGVGETRDLILEFYLTLQRMIFGGVSATNMMGPVGMFHAGAQLASRGWNWLIWFLANISANLAVVNFLPIPIVDGGLFTLLILEKIQGKPLSPDAQKIVQMVGLVLILGVFLLVTYQDIARIYGS